MKLIRPVNGIFWLVVMAMGLSVMAASSPQCARSDDRALNPSLDALGNPLGPCKQDCIADFIADKKAEQARHKGASKACNENVACKALEDALHLDIVNELVALKDACQLACEHQQGAGLGGQ